MRLLSEAKKAKFPLTSVIRKIVQVLAFLLINYPLFELIFDIDLSVIMDLHLPYPFLQTPRSFLFRGNGGAGLMENILYSIGSGLENFPFFFLGVLMLLSLVLGRFSCGWLCPIGLFQDILYVFVRKDRRKKMSIQTDKTFKQVKKWVLWVIVVIMVFLGGMATWNRVTYIDWKDTIGTFLRRPLAGFSLSEFIFYTLPQMIATGASEMSFTAMFENGWAIFLPIPAARDIPGTYNCSVWQNGSEVSDGSEK